MKRLSNTLKTLITEHSIDILQQEQRLKAMLADLLPHDKQMRFLLELSLRAQIPQKLIAQQNETRIGWEAQIKSMKHYFKDEYFLEDKAVNSVFDCWVEVLPRKKQKAAPPKLGNLYAKSKIKNIDPITWHNWHKFAFKQNSNWQPFFEKSNITNYQSFFKDIGIIKNSNNTGSYPKLLLPLSLQNEVEKQPPLELPEKSYYFDTRFQYTKEDFDIINRLSNQKSYKELNDYCEKRGINDFDRKKKKEKEEYEKREQERKNIQSVNADKTKTFSLEQFLQFAVLLGCDTSPIYEPRKPELPKKMTKGDSNLESKFTYEEDSKVKGFSSARALVFTIIGVVFFFLFKFSFRNKEFETLFFIVFWPSVIFVPAGALTGIIMISRIVKYIVALCKFIKMNSKKQKQKKIDESIIIEAHKEQKYQDELANYKNVLLPQYENDFKTYEKKRDEQIKDLNEAFPLIARQIWLQAITTKLNSLNTGSSSDSGIVVKKLVARLALLYPQILKVGVKFPDLLYATIILHVNNKVIINIEIDEPYNRETRQEKNFIGSYSEKRDIICSEKNLFVLRFTESQVTYALSECVSIVQELVLFTQSAITQHLLNIREVSKKIEVLCWTKEEAKLMALNED